MEMAPEWGKLNLRVATLQCASQQIRTGTKVKHVAWYMGVGAKPAWMEGKGLV